jgi:predicted small secreted protein
MKRTLLIVAAIILVAALLLFAFGKIGCNSSECGEKKK